MQKQPLTILKFCWLFTFCATKERSSNYGTQCFREIWIFHFLWNWPVQGKQEANAKQLMFKGKVV